MNAVGLVLFRSISAGLLLFFTILLSKNLSFKIEKRDWHRVFINSMALALFLIPFWQGLKILAHIPTVYALYFTYPFWMALMAIAFLKERFTLVKKIALIMGTIGTFFAIGFLPNFSIENINLLSAGIFNLKTEAFCPPVSGGTGL